MHQQKDETEFFNLGLDIFCVTDKEWRIVNVNKAFESILGYSPNEIIGEHLWKFIEKKSLGNSKHQAKLLLTGLIGEIHQEIRFRTKTGTFKWISWNATLKNDKIYGVGRDCTSERSFSDKLKATNLQLLAFVRNAPAIIAMLDTDLHFLEVSERFVKDSGLEKSKLLGKSVYEIFPETAEKRRMIHEKVLNGDSFHEDEVEFILPDGRKEYYEMEIRPWYNEEGKICGIISLKNNISFKKVAQAEMQRKSQMLNGILQNIPVIIYEIDDKGNIENALGLGLKKLGLVSGNLKGKEFKNLFNNNHDLIDEALTKKPVYFISESEYMGKKVYFENYLFPDNVRNKGVIGFAFDITTIKETEHLLLREKEKALEMSKSKSYFLANMSHEIRTPLNAIIGFSNVLKKLSSNDNQREYIDYILASGDTLTKLIGDILDFSKIETGTLELEEKTFNLRETLTEALMPYKYKANEAGLSFNLHFDEFLPKYVSGDLGKVKQCIINLVGNSIKYNREGGISVTVSNEASYLSTNQVRVNFSIADTGIGIPEEDQEYVFESFHQGELAQKNHIGGSGLGLSIVHNLVNVMKGKIRLVSPNNNTKAGGPGTLFSFSITFLVSEPKEERQESNKNIILPQSLSVLLVEDNELNRKLAKLVLKELNCKVSSASNGEEAINMCRHNIYDLILMDLRMPVLNGFDATKTIREFDKNIPIIGLTATALKDDKEHALSCGMNDFLTKPYSEEQLLDVIKKYTNQVLDKREKTEGSKTLKILSMQNKDNVVKLINVFKKQRDEMLPEIEGMIKMGDKKEASEMIHKFKGSVKALNLNRSLAKILAMEMILRENENPDPEELLAILTELKALISDDMEQLQYDLQIAV